MKRLLTSTLAVVLAAVSFGAVRMNGVLVASHRADWKLAPENSLAALENAIRYGVDIVETDVRRTKDGHLVIVDRAQGNKMPFDVTLKEVEGGFEMLFMDGDAVDMFFVDRDTILGHMNEIAQRLG